MLSRRFVLVMAVTLLFFLYVGVQLPLIPRLIENQLGGNEIDIGVNIAVFSAAAVAVRPWLGRWSDRYGLRVLMICGALAAAGAASLVPLVDDRFLLLPLRAIAGAGEGAVFVGAATIVNDLAPSHRRAEAMSYLSLALFCGLGLGPIISEAVVTGSDYDRGFLVAAVFGVGAALCATAVPAGAPVHDDDDVEVDLPRFHRAALRPGAVLALAMAGFATFNAFVPDHALAVGLDGSKWVFVAYSAVCLVMRLFAARVPDRLGLARTGSFALCCMSLGLTTMWAFATPGGLFSGVIVMSVGMSFLYPALSTIAVNSVPARERSRVVSTFTMFFEIGSAVGGLAFGIVAHFAGKRGGFLGGAVAGVLALWVLWRVLLPWLRGRPIPASEASVTAAH